VTSASTPAPRDKAARSAVPLDAAVLRPVDSMETLAAL
jgi:hypothetical protein